MNYEQRLRTFEAAVEKLALPKGVLGIQFNDGGENDYQVFVSLDLDVLPNLRGIARKVKNLLDTIDGVRCYQHYGPTMTYEWDPVYQVKRQTGYDREYITINLRYYPEEPEGAGVTKVASTSYLSILND